MTSSARARAPVPTPAAARRETGGVRESERDQKLATWLAAAATGDGGAFEAFYEATFAYARTVARRLLRDNSEIEDLLADCYFEAWRRAAQFDPLRGSPVTWLLTLVRSRGLDALRAAAARPDRSASGSAGPASASAAAEGSETGQREDPAASLPDPAPDADPAERLWRRQAGAELHAALATLSAPERWVLGLAYLRELSHAEIAERTGMPLGTVKSHALRAQNKLRDCLAPSLLGRAGGAAWQTTS